MNSIAVLCLYLSISSFTSHSHAHFAEAMSDSTAQIYQVILQDLKTYVNIQERRILFDKRVLQWLDDLPSIRKPLIFEQTHDEEFLMTIMSLGLIDGFAIPKEMEGFNPMNWHCHSDTTSAAISLSDPHVSDSGGYWILCWVETVHDFRHISGRVLGFINLLRYEVKFHNDLCVVIERKVMLIS